VLGGAAALLNSIVSGNTVSQGNGPLGTMMRGFGLYIENAEVSIDHSTVSGNTNNSAAARGVFHGFGIFNSGTVRIANSAVVRNAATQLYPRGAGAGGGIYNAGAMFIDDSTVAENTAGTLGGGIANFGKLTLRRATVTRNQVAGITQGAPGRIPYPVGCGIVPPDTDGCIVGGGGIWIDPAATTTALSSALALNTLATSAPGGSFGPDCAGTIVSDGHNAIGATTDCQLQRPGSSTPAASDLLGVDAELGDLTDDGAPGHAHVPLLRGSALIDGGGKVFFGCAARDQLGELRNDGDHDGRVECDVGAVEFQRNQRRPNH